MGEESARMGSVVFDLNSAEMENLRRAASARKREFNPKQTRYSDSELREFGFVREAYNSQELVERGFSGHSIVTSFDEAALSARSDLIVETPFGSGIRKWQLPFDECEWRILMTEFSPGTHVSPHVHPAHTDEKPGGSFRLVVSGALDYRGQTFKPGDWFYIPNGVPYAFKTASDEVTVVLYTYAFFKVAEGNRFSHPHSTSDR